MNSDTAKPSPQAERPKEVRDKCACGAVELKRGIDFWAVLDTGMNHTRMSCRKMRGWTDWGDKND